MLRGIKPPPSCRQKLYLQRIVSGDIFPVVLECNSNRCPEHGAAFRRKQIEWLYHCFTTAGPPLHVGGVNAENWTAVRRFLQRHDHLFVWVQDISRLRLVVATGPFATSAGGRAPMVTDESALGLLLYKLRDINRLAPRFLDACEEWRRERPRRETPTSRRLGIARPNVAEDELLEIARELHGKRGGVWPISAPHPTDLTPNDFGNLFAEAIDEDKRRNRQRRSTP
jgi:hypothetical protein